MNIEQEINSLKIQVTAMEHKFEGKLDTQTQLLASYLAFNKQIQTKLDKLEAKVWTIGLGLAGISAMASYIWK